MNKIKKKKMNDKALLNISASGVARMKKPSETSKLEQILSFLPLNFKSQKPLISVIRLSGVIGRTGSMRQGLTIESLNEIIEKAFAYPKLSLVCLVINSPGGSPVQSELIAKRITSLAKEKKVPVYSFVEDVAASGGYWLACAGDKIYASKSSIVGSIGVISSGFGFEDAIKKLGIERRVYSQGKNKSILDPFQKVKADDIKIIKHLQKQIHQHFINFVKERRGHSLTQSDDVIFNGEFWAGLSALDFGLIDGIDDMYSVIKDEFGPDARIEYVEFKQPWLKRKLGMVSHSPIAPEIVNEIIDNLENRIKSSWLNFK